MKIERLQAAEVEELWRASDPAISFTAYIAIYNTQRGPAVGGVRLWSYPDATAAREDVIRLAKAMTYKAAVADLPCGGGKGVMIRPPGAFDRNLFCARFAEFINHLEGRYITAKDVGTDATDMLAMQEVSQGVTGIPESAGGAGDPSPLTARGVVAGIRVTIQECLGREKLAGSRIVIQGLGGVGAEVARRLAEEGCELWGSDVDPKRLASVAQETGLRPLLPELVLSQAAELFCPCALGQVLHRENIKGLKFQAVAGGANDPLCDPEADAQQLQGQGILYAPDFVVNAGGLIHVVGEWEGWKPERVRAKVDQIGETLAAVFALARQDKISTHAAALRMAQERLKGASKF